MIKIDPSEITPEYVFMNRRKFMAGAASMVAGTVLAACGRAGGMLPGVTEPPALKASSTVDAPVSGPSAVPASPTSIAQFTVTPNSITPQAQAQVDELGNKLTPYQSVTGYNNYYEFTFDKEGVDILARNMPTRPWQVEVGGLAKKPRAFTIEELLAFEQEERIYRLRCVEGWSMVVPWIGFPLRKLLEAVEPAPEAQFVRFQTALAPQIMFGLKSTEFPWPYTEGLRMDEAMHDLTILATGLYGKPLTEQNGAPIRLVVPWKYAFKYCKSLVRIDLLAEMPETFWASYAPHEYGFYANVNPNVSHPRWSQATERRIGEAGRRQTLMFNGYEQEVASLYEGMDLTANY
jgi:sulfoxide reductase catalytic subunit YedY